jgi:chromosomal replication initiator protein
LRRVEFLWITGLFAPPAPYNPAAPKRVFHNMSADLWQRGCERLAAELPEQQFNTWIRPLPAADVADAAGGSAVVTLRVPNRFKLDWIRNQYAGRIEAVLSELAGKPVRLEIALAAREGNERPASNGMPAAAASSAPLAVAHLLNGTARVASSSLPMTGGANGA